MGDIEITLTKASYRRMFISIDDNPTVTISKPYLLNVRPFVETIQSTARWALGISETETRVRKSSDFQPAREYSAELSNWRFDIDDWTSPVVARKRRTEKPLVPVRFCVVWPILSTFNERFTAGGR